MDPERRAAGRLRATVAAGRNVGGASRVVRVMNRPALAPRPRARSTALVAWLPFALLAAAGAVGDLRLPVLGCLAVGALVLARSDPAGITWAAALPLAASFAWGVIPPPQALPGAASCADPLSPPAAWRALEAGLVVVVTLCVARRCGGLRPILLRRPPGPRSILLACAAPALVPIVLFLGPALARPFFGEVGFVLDRPAALLPAALLAGSNGLLEELSYRGALMGWCARAVGPRGALAGQAIVFGFAHLAGHDLVAGAPILWAGIVVAGFAAGIVARRTGSLLVPIAVHAALDVPLYYYLACSTA